MAKNDFKKLVLGNAGAKKTKNPFKGSKGRKKKGNWEGMMYGETEASQKKKKGGNFWVDTGSWF